MICGKQSALQTENGKYCIPGGVFSNLLIDMCLMYPGFAQTPCGIESKQYKESGVPVSEKLIGRNKKYIEKIVKLPELKNYKNILNLI